MIQSCIYRGFEEDFFFYTDYGTFGLMNGLFSVDFSARKRVFKIYCVEQPEKILASLAEMLEKLKILSQSCCLVETFMVC